MTLKLLVFAIAAILIYKFLGGKLPTFRKSSDENKLDENTLVECATCHTYATVKESIVVGGKYYCSTECAP